MTIVVADPCNAALVSRTIASVLAQTARGIHVVVASAAAEADTSPSALGEGGRRCDVVHLPGAQLGRLLQAGLQRSRASYVKFLLAGDVLVPECIERQLDVLGRYPQPAATFCRVASPSIGEDAARCSTAVSGWLVDLPCSGGTILRELLRGAPPPLGAALVRRAALESVGGFDATFVACPDEDLWLRMLPAIAVRGCEDALLSPGIERVDWCPREVALAERGRALVAAFSRLGSDVLIQALGDGRWIDVAAERIDVARRLLVCGAPEGRVLAHRLVVEALALGATWPDDDDRLAPLRWLAPEVRRPAIPPSLRGGGTAPRRDDANRAAPPTTGEEATFPPRLRLALWWEDVDATGAASLLERAEVLAGQGIDLALISQASDPRLDSWLDRGVAVEVLRWRDSGEEIVAVLDHCRADVLIVSSSRPAAEVARRAGVVVLERMPAESAAAERVDQEDSRLVRILQQVAASASEQRSVWARTAADARMTHALEDAATDAYRTAADGLRDPASCTGRMIALGWNAEQSGDLIEIAREASALSVLGTELRARSERLLDKLRLATRAESGLRVLRSLLRGIGKPQAAVLESGTLERFVSATLAEPSPWLWVIYATDPYSETRGQRSTWLAQELARRGHRVVYLYWRWELADEILASGDERVLSVPLDQLPVVQAQLLGLVAPGLEKVFLAEFPDVALFERLNLFSAHGFVTVYDCVDEWAEFSRLGQAHWYDEAVERHLARNADVVVATHPLLAAKLGAMSDRPVAIVPNGVKRDSLQPPSEARCAGAAPVVGYFGHLTSSWFDWELIVESAARNPGWRFEIIGYGEPAGLLLPANVILLGKVAHSDLAQRTAHWAAAIIPFRTGPLTQAVDPVKLYEYLALGMPVVAVDMPHLRTVPGVVVCDRTGFDAAVRQSLSQPTDPSVVAAFVAESTWRRRLDAILELVANADRTRNVVKALAG